MNPEDFKKSLRYKNRHMFIEVSGESISICRSNQGPEWHVD